MAKQVEKTTKELLDEAQDVFDYINEIHPTADFIEVVGVRGGDHRTYRFYYSGLITER